MVAPQVRGAPGGGIPTPSAESRRRVEALSASAAAVEMASPSSRAVHRD